MVVLLVEAAKHRQDERLVGNCLTNVAQSVGERLELGAVVMDGHVTLRCVAKFRIQSKGAAFLVVVEEVGDGVLDLPRRRPRCHDDAEELGGDQAVNP